MRTKSVLIISVMGWMLFATSACMAIIRETEFSRGQEKSSSESEVVTSADRGSSRVKNTSEISKKSMKPAAVLRQSGFRGTVYERTPQGSIGPVISGATITFTKEDKRIRKTVQSTVGGQYQIELSVGRYTVKATHPHYQGYSTEPGFFVVTGNGFQTGNIFMVKQCMTTVLLIRHRDYDPTAGPQRSQELIHVAEKARVKAIFATNTTRSQETVLPLAQSLGLTPIIYNYPTGSQDLANLKDTVLGQYAGEVVLVAGHSDTLHLIVQAFGGDPGCCTMTSGDEFDNLCVVTTFDGEKASVVNLQYGANTP